MIKKLIVVGILLTTSVFAEKAIDILKKNVKKAIPYGFILGKTTCAEIGKKFKALDNTGTDVLVADNITVDEKNSNFNTIEYLYEGEMMFGFGK